MFPSSSSTQSSGNLVEEEAKKEPEEIEDTRRTRPSESNEQGSDELTETEAV